MASSFLDLISASKVHVAHELHFGRSYAARWRYALGQGLVGVGGARPATAATAVLHALRRASSCSRVINCGRLAALLREDFEGIDASDFRRRALRPRNDEVGSRQQRPFRLLGMSFVLALFGVFGRQLDSRFPFSATTTTTTTPECAKPQASSAEIWCFAATHSTSVSSANVPPRLDVVVLCRAGRVVEGSVGVRHRARREPWTAHLPTTTTFCRWTCRRSSRD